MSVIGRLYALVGADTSEFTRKMKDISGVTKQVGKSLTKNLTLPIVAVGAAIVAVSAKFEKSLANAISVTGDYSDETAEKMENLARAMGEKTAFSASQAADAMYYMASAGWKADQMALALEDTLNLAGATQSDLAFTTDTVVASLNMFEMGAGEAGRVADVYANAISNSQATLDKLAISMGYVGPLFNSLGYSIEDSAAALGVLYNKGIDASTAGTSLRMSLAKLLEGSDKTTGALDAMGISLSQVNPETHSLAEIVDVLAEKSMTAKQAVEIFGIRGANAMLNLASTGTEGLAKLRGALDETGSAQKMYNKQMETLSGQWQILKSKLEEAALMLGKIIVPIVKDLVEKVKGWIDAFNALSEGTKRTIVKIAGFLAILGPVLLITSKVAAILPIIAGGLKLVGINANLSMGPLAAIVGALAGIWFYYKHINKKQDAYNKSTLTAAEKTAQFNEKLEKNKEELTLSAEAADNLRAAFGENADAISLTKKETEEYKFAQASLAEKTEDVKDEQDEFTKAIEETTAAMTEEIRKATKIAEELAQIEKDLDAAKLASEEWAKRLTEMSVLTIPQKIAAVKVLESEIAKLDEMYAKGDIHMEDYINATHKLKGQIEELSTTMIETAVPAAADWREAVSLASATIADNDMPKITGAVKKTTEESSTMWTEFADGLKTTWAQSFSEMIEMPSWLRDSLPPIFTTIYDQFADMVGAMASEWLIGFIMPFKSSTKDAAEEVVGSVSDVADAAKGLAKGFSPGGLIATAIGTAIGTFLGGLLGPKGAGQRDTQMIKDNTWLTSQVLKINVVKNLDDIKWSLWNTEDRIRNIMLNGWSLWERLKTLPNQLKDISSNILRLEGPLGSMAVNLNELVKLMRNLKRYGHGGLVHQEQIAIIGDVPEVIIPLQNLDKIGTAPGGEDDGGGNGGGGTGKGTHIEIHQHYTAMDSEDVYRVFVTKGLDALLDMIRNNTGGLTREIAVETENY